MALKSIKNDPDSPSDASSSLLAEGKASLWVFWRVFWKVTAITTILLVLLFFAVHTEDLMRRWNEVVFAVLVIGGYSLIISLWVGIGVGLFALAWRWFGSWILVPIGGALLGAFVATAVVYRLLLNFDFDGAGLHGGGHVAAFLLFGLLVVSAILGAIGGGFLTGLPAAILALITQKQRASTKRHPEY